ncbi:MAG TPA: protoporphyrinogen oxidase [Polyangia bacterium]|jgi:oxygen-dependent protoporphyrinogen oxidase
MSRIVIVGAGISGLATAFEIRRRAAAAGTPVELTVLEEDALVGGKVRTRREEGYLCEWGVQAFLDNSPPTLELAHDLGLDPVLRRASPEAKKRWIYSRGALRPLPESPPAFLKSRLVSWRGKLRMACEPFIGRRKDGVDETLAEFARRRLGREALEVLIGPMVSGIFAGDPTNLSVKSAFPKVAVLEQKHGSLIRGMIALKKARGGPASAGPAGVLTSFDDGMATPCLALARELGEAVRLGHAVAGLARDGAGWTVRLAGDAAPLRADAVVLAVPAYVQRRLLAPLDAAAADLLGQVPYPTLAVLCLGYRRDEVAHPLDGFGYLIPRREGVTLLGALFESTLFAGRAPAGHVLVRAMIGGATNPEVAALDDAGLLAAVRADLATTAGITAAPVFERIYRHEAAIPQYTPGHAARIEELAARAVKLGPLLLTGNAYRGISFNDCVRNARDVADEALALVRRASAAA